MRRCFAPLAVVLAPALLLQHSASALTIVPPATLGELALQSEAIVLATALDNRTAMHGAISTRTTFAVTRAVSGPVAEGQLIDIKVPGGEIDGLGLAVPGAPRFTVGATYLLFLDGRPDGTWQPRLMSYGILVEVSSGDTDGGSVLRPLEEYREVNALPRVDGATVEWPGTYGTDALLDLLADVTSGRSAWDASRALVVTADLHAASPPAGCSFAGFRFALFDTGGYLRIAAEISGDATLPGGGFGQVQGAAEMWSGVGTSTIDTRYNGERVFTPDCGAMPPNDDIVLFNDPCDEIPDLTGCSGYLAYGGAYFTSSTSIVDGQPYYNASSWFVVVNNGAGCVGPSTYQVMIAHELGHGLGFEHITSQPSLMNPGCEGGSCSGLQGIDLTCASYLYPSQTSGPPPAPTSVQASDGTYTDRVRVTWGSSFGATSYEVFRNTTDNSGGAQSVGSTSGTTLDDTTAIPGTTYYYWVQAANGEGTSDLGGPDTGYAVVCEDPETPTASAPPTALTGDYYTVSWTGTSPSGTYDLQEAADPSFAGASTYQVSVTNRTFRHFVGLDTTFYYRVRARFSCGGSTLYSPYSEAVQTVVQVSCSDPSAPTISAPSAGSSGVPYVVSWSGTSSDNTYDLQEATDAGFATATTYPVTGSSRSFTHVVGVATTYYYRVRATQVCNSATYTSAYSSAAQTVVNPPCDAPPTPALTAPASSNSGVAYAVSWTATSPTSSYEVQESTSPSFGGAGTLQVSGTSQSFSHVVTVSTTYYYRVRASNECGYTTAYSPFSSGKATVVNPQCDPPGTVALGSPTDGSSLTPGATSVQLSWQAATGAGAYDLYFGTSSSPPLAASGLGATSTTRSVTPGNTYYWRVVAHAGCETSLTSTSPTWSFFATPVTPPPVASFSVSPGPYIAGFSIQFTDTSTGGPTGWSWDFGDGGASSAQSPAHTFLASGSYLVTLTASNAGGSAQAATTIVVAAPAPTQIVAVVAHNLGLGLSAWRSDLGVSNPGDESATFDVTYKPSGGSDTTSTTLTVLPRSTAWLDDVMATFLGVGNGRGSLRIVPPAAGPSPAVFSRTYATAAAGNLGQGVPSMVALPAGVYAVPGLFQDDAYRTNLGMTAGPSEVHVMIELFRGTSPNPVAGPVSLTVGAWDQQQWSLADLFPGAAQPAVAMTARITTDGPGIPWASIVDQVSRDSVFRVGVAAVGDWFVPVIAHNPGAELTYWRTDIGLWNASDSTISVTGFYMPTERDNADGGIPEIIATLPPHGSAVVEDVAGAGFGVTNGKGALRLSAGGQPFVAASRTYTTRSEGGTLGQGIMAVPTASIGNAARTVAGFRMDGANRTNIGLATPDDGVTVDLVLRDANGAVLGSRTGLWVQSRSLLQMTFADAFPGTAIPSQVGAIEILPNGAVILYLSVIDGSSNDPSFVMAY